MKNYKMVSKKTAYGQEQTEASYPEGIENHYWQYARAKIIFNEIKRVDIQGGKFLEIGCNKGNVVKLLRKRHLNIHGVELADVVPLESVKHYVTTNTDAVDLDKNFRKSIDVVMLFDVIEHIEDPIGFLKNILTHYPNVKYLVFTIPARKELWSNYDTFFGHFRRYNLKEVQKHYTDINFRLLSSKYFYHSIYFALICIVKVIKARKTAMSIPKGISFFIHRFIAFFLYLEYLILPSKLYGSSIISIGKKKDNDVD